MKQTQHTDNYKIEYPKYIQIQRINNWKNKKKCNTFHVPLLTSKILKLNNNKNN